MPDSKPTPLDHFDDWLSHRGWDDRDPLTPAAAEPYRYIWQSWCRYLAGEGVEGEAAVDWLQVTPSHVFGFLRDGVSPSSGRKSRTAPISDITRRRYWRVLDAIYQHACNKGLLHRNPVTADGGDPEPPREDPEGQVFHLLHWKAIHTGFPAGDSRWDVRDRAILAILTEAALTNSEVCSLRLNQVGDHLSKVTLRLDGKRAAQERTLQLDRSASVDVRKWIEIRRGLKPRPGAAEDAVFITQRGYQLSTRAVFYKVATTITRAFTENDYEVPNHIGAQVLRNTRLVMWLNSGVPVDEVVRRAGFKDARSFRGLRRHIHPDVLSEMPFKRGVTGL